MPKRGFTLVELLVTIALAAVVMIALMKVIGSTTRSADAIRNIDVRAKWQSDIISVIEWDLANATEVKTEAGSRLIVLGYGALDRRTSEPKHEPVEVTYELTESNDSFMLIRRQSQLNDPTNLAIHQEIMCVGVRGFSVSIEAASAMDDVESQAAVGSNEPAIRGSNTAQRQPNLARANEASKNDGPRTGNDAVSDQSEDSGGLRMPSMRNVVVSLKWLDTETEDLTETFYVWQ